MPKVIFKSADGSETVEVTGAVGESLLDLAWANSIDMEGACEGEVACSTCHVIVAKEWMDRLPTMSEEEDDMLDLALDVTRWSRLGCQIKLTEALDGLIVRLPASTRSMLD